MLAPLLVAFTALTASAQVEPDGDTVLGPCLAQEACGPWLTRNLSETLLEVGLGLQHEPLATSAIAGKGMGVVAELQVATLPLGDRNALGEQLPIPPLVPRIEVGYQYGSYTYDDPYPQGAIGVFALPPVQVGGGSVYSLGGELSGAVPVVGHLVWLGAEAGWSRAVVSAPLVGSRARIAAHPELDGYLDASAVVCEGDCVDRFTQDALAGRLGVSFEPVGGLFLFGRLAAVGWWQRLEVALDDSRWTMRGVQPQAHLGGGIRAGDKYQLSSTLVVGGKPEALSTDGEGALVRLTVGTSFRFGRARYWDDEG